MSSARVAALALGLVFWVGFSLAAQEDPAREESAAPALVLFESPPSGAPAVGDIEIAVQVMAADEVDEVVFLVDGAEVGRVTAPPYRVTHSFGDDLGSHLLEVVVRTVGGEVVSATRETPAVRVDDTIELGLRQLYVTVTSRNDESPVLAAEDFRVRDDGREQELVTFEGGDAALAVALLVDSSDSMRGPRLAAALGGVEAFLGGMKELDEASIYLFSDAIHHRDEFSQQSVELAAALEGVEARGGTALNDALYAAIRALEARQGRRVVVVLSDGYDIHSVLGIEDVLWAMRRSRSMIYWIALEEGQYSVLSAWRSSEQHSEERRGLRRLDEESGGRVVPISGPEEARSAFGEILEELRRQYVLGYYPTLRRGDGRWHKVDVRLRRPGFQVRTRGGYVDW